MTQHPLPPLITIVGKSGSGKTTLLEKLISEFKHRGYRVGTIKHHLHDFEIDREGKDSWRHAKAGADNVVIATPEKLAMIKKTGTDTPVDELRDRMFYDVDIVLAEGYKTADRQWKVEVFRASVHDRPLFRDVPTLLATVTDTDVDTGAPCFEMDDILPLADYLEQICLETKLNSE